MQHGTKNGYVGILFWLEPGAKKNLPWSHFFGTGGLTPSHVEQYTLWDCTEYTLVCLEPNRWLH